jgi:hypothetical protein
MMPVRVSSGTRVLTVNKHTFSMKLFLSPQVACTPSDTGPMQQSGEHHAASAEFRPRTGVRGER